VTAAWNRLLEDSSWKTVLVVAHGGVNRALLAHALGAPLSSYGSMEQDEACVNIIDADDLSEGKRRQILRMLNYTPYDTVKKDHVLTTMERLLKKLTGKVPSL
jgi:broad specificity phosphatase PhoE